MKSPWMGKALNAKIIPIFFVLKYGLNTRKMQASGIIRIGIKVVREFIVVLFILFLLFLLAKSMNVYNCVNNK